MGEGEQGAVESRCLSREEVTLPVCLCLQRVEEHDTPSRVKQDLYSV